MHKKFIAIGALLGAFSVGLGAFASHTLKNILSTDVLQIFETAVRYQFYHVFAIVVVGILYKQHASKTLQWAGYLFCLGILLFSGSLYLLCYVKHQQLAYTWVGAITPLGGVCFIIGWIMVAFHAKKYL
jgi:uncharacterized membrane protein YgdD (TMEM256/DUF423 family)